VLDKDLGKNLSTTSGFCPKAWGHPLRVNQPPFIRPPLWSFFFAQTGGLFVRGVSRGCHLRGHSPFLFLPLCFPLLFFFCYPPSLAFWMFLTQAWSSPPLPRGAPGQDSSYPVVPFPFFFSFFSPSPLTPPPAVDKYLVTCQELLVEGCRFCSLHPPIFAPPTPHFLAP